MQHPGILQELPVPPPGVSVELCIQDAQPTPDLPASVRVVPLIVLDEHHELGLKLVDVTLRRRARAKRLRGSIQPEFIFPALSGNASVDEGNNGRTQDRRSQ